MKEEMTRENAVEVSNSSGFYPDMINELLEYKSLGVSVSMIINNKRVYSCEVDENTVYQDVFGMSRSEYLSNPELIRYRREHASDPVISRDDKHMDMLQRYLGAKYSDQEYVDYEAINSFVGWSNIEIVVENMLKIANYTGKPVRSFANSDPVSIEPDGDILESIRGWYSTSLGDKVEGNSIEEMNDDYDKKLTRKCFRKRFIEEGVPEDEIESKIDEAIESLEKERQEREKAKMGEGTKMQEDLQAGVNENYEDVSDQTQTTVEKTEISK